MKTPRFVIAIRVVKFSNGRTKLERFLTKNQRKLLNFELWINDQMPNSAKNWLSKSIFYVKNHPNLFSIFFIQKYQFRSTFIVSTNQELWCCSSIWDVFLAVTLKVARSFLTEVIPQIWLDRSRGFWGCWASLINYFFRPLRGVVGL